MTKEKLRILFKTFSLFEVLINLLDNIFNRILHVMYSFRAIELHLLIYNKLFRLSIILYTNTLVTDVHTKSKY